MLNNLVAFYLIFLYFPAWVEPVLFSGQRKRQLLIRSKKQNHHESGKQREWTFLLKVDLISSLPLLFPTLVLFLLAACYTIPVFVKKQKQKTKTSILYTNKTQVRFFQL